MNRPVLLILLIFYCAASVAQRSKDFYLSGAAKMQSGDIDSAVYYLNQAITWEPDRYQYYIKLGEALYAAGRYDEAIKSFEGVESGKAFITFLWLSRCYAKTGNNVKSLEYLKDYLHFDNRLPDKEIKRDEAYDQLQLTDGWFQLWQDVTYAGEASLEDDILYLINNEKYVDAIALIDKKTENSENPGILYRYRAEIEGLQGNYKASAMDWTELINRNKNDYLAYKERGKAYLKAEKFAESVSDFSKALRLEPADFELYILKARAEKGLKDYSSAEEELLIYLDYFPEDKASIQFLGELYYEEGNYVGALKAFNKNLLLDNSNAVYYKARGKTYLKTRMYKYAIEDLSMSLDLNAEDGETYYYKAMARYYSGDRPGACADWKEAATRGEARAVRELIDNCR